VRSKTPETSSTILWNSLNLNMKLLLAFLSLGLAMAAASPQFGFLGNFFGRRPNRPSRPFGRPPQSTRFNSGSSSGGGCGGGHAPNHVYDGKDYLLSWSFNCNGFTHGQAASFCRSNGMQPISIESSAEESHFKNLLATSGKPYFWTGGRVSGRSISWPSGRSYNNVEWSHTGGARRPQPDNREGNEFCLGVLNNFYQDGIKFHDIACHHKKPVICEKN